MRKTSAAFLFSLLALAGHAFADVQLPGIISDHMLLQRDVPVRIFGKALPGEAVTVAYRGRTAQTVTDPLGRWEVWLQPLTPGPAAEMTITGANTITIADVSSATCGSAPGSRTCSGRSGRQTTRRQRSRQRTFRRSGCSMSRESRLGSRRGRRGQVGCLLAGIDRRVLRGPVFLRPADAPGPQGADGIDPFVVGRHADRLVDQRTVAGRRPAARAVPYLLAERHPAVPGEREPLRAEPEEMGSERIARAASRGADGAGPRARADDALQRDDRAAGEVHDQGRALVSGRDGSRAARRDTSTETR